MSPGDVIDPGAGAADAYATAVGPNSFRIEVPAESFRTVFLEMIFSPSGGEPVSSDDERLKTLAIGTGFFYRVDGRDFILTARHNITGRHWETNEFLCKDYPVQPTHLRLALRGSPPPQGWSTTLGSTQMHIPFTRHLIPLVDEEFEPLWFEHPEHGPAMDVAAVAFSNPDDDRYLIIGWEPQSDTGADSKLWVTQDVSIIGYPFGLVSGPALPLWIRGTIASEPAFNYIHRQQTLPAFLVDARTRPGQSGSPTVLFRLPSTPVPSDDGSFRWTLGTHSRLLGVYTGRISKDSDLGFVWHVDEAARICREGVRPQQGATE
ncbi:trypsin-like peptidase domain-containing protein [Mycobacterium marinum]|uniref:trypsin-like peptidase domain-containing protein n=1 Tax=Mycobacterium marinum TaxID=1781 RepID=UPI0023596B8F|nr:trypsin-like peptidase domain-containing protein [Mycobacterium marinum]MDC8973992.1 trypsin-like peptidase domain-containing protein [Mycobacterium marinum]